jgi:hypothetical protein
MTKNPVAQSVFWRYVVIFWTAILFVTIIKDVASQGALADLIGPIAAIYTACLAIYSAEKEFERWEHQPIGRHPGEIYVALWTILILALLFGQATGYLQYKLEPEIISTYIVVLGILAITKKSKIYFVERNDGEK